MKKATLQTSKSAPGRPAAAANKAAAPNKDNPEWDWPTEASQAPDEGDGASAKASRASKGGVGTDKGGKKQKKGKVVRDSFTMPAADYAKLAELKKKCLAAGVPVKKNELLRAGLHALETLSSAKLKALVGELENVKTGRPPVEQASHPVH